MFFFSFTKYGWLGDFQLREKENRKVINHKSLMLNIVFFLLNFKREEKQYGKQKEAVASSNVETQHFTFYCNFRKKTYEINS